MMDKFGVRKDILHSDLRDEEAQLMQEMQGLLSDGEKTAEDKRANLESRLQQVRLKITELDTKN